MEVRPHVGIDGRNLVLAAGTGVSSYGANLVRALPLAGFAPMLLRAEPALPRAVRWMAAALPLPSRAAMGDAEWSAADVYRVGQVHFDVWRRLRPVVAAAPPALMHWTYPLPLRLVGRPNVYTVHDVIPLLHPALTGIDARRAERMLRRIVDSAAHLVTVSEATRQEMIATLGLEPQGVTNTGQSVDVTGADAVAPAGVGIGRYWLMVGTVERRKNIRALIAAWRASGSICPLVIAGPDGWGAEAELNDARGLVRLPFLPRGALLALMRDARAVLMPSLAEGFGLPVAEAMALGTPVLTSDRGALAEVAGGAALLVDPEDYSSLVAGLRRLDGDEALRGRLRAAGLVRAETFGVEAYAGRLRAVYGGVLGWGPAS